MRSDYAKWLCNVKANSGFTALFSKISQTFSIFSDFWHSVCSITDWRIPSRTEVFAPIQFKTLFTTVPVMARVQSESRPVTHHKSIPPCLSRIWMNIMMAAILAQVFSPASRTQCPNMDNEILIQMQQFRITKTTAVVQKKSTGSLIWTIGKVLHCILISLIFISISCRLLFEYTLFTIGKLIMCRNAADFESSTLVSRMVSIFSDCYDLWFTF